MAGLKRLIQGIVSLFFPKRCPFCGAVIKQSELICNSCSASLPLIQQPVCRRCGRELSLCECKNKIKEYERLIAPFYYEGPVKRGIHRIKFQKKSAGTAAFAYYMEKSLSVRCNDVHFDDIVPVPMTKKEITERGFNQSVLLGKELSRHFGIPLSETLIKPNEIKPQRSCSEKERWGNVFGAFTVSKKADFTDKTLLLVDDVSTTGATLNECAKVLKLAGAKNVCCAVAACVKRQTNYRNK